MLFESKRLKFRFFSKEDKMELIEILNDKVVTKWAHLPFPYTEKHAKWWINIGSKKKYHFALEEKNKKKLLGSIKLTEKGELGCWIGKEYWNQGFATEAVEKIKEFGFRELKLERIWAAAHIENIAPIEVLKNSGFTRLEDKPYYVEGIGNTKVRPHFELLNRP